MKPLIACLLLVTTLHPLVADAGPDISEKAFDTALALSKAGKYTEAEQALRALVEVCTEALGAEARQTLKCRMLLVHTMSKQHKYAEAEPECRSLIIDMSRVLGQKDAQTLNERAELTTILYNQEKYAEVEREYRSLVADMTRVLGPENAQTLTERSQLVRVLVYQEKYNEAEQECRSLVADMTRALGPEHHETLAGRSALAVILIYQRKFAKAMHEQRAILTIRERVLGAGDKATLTTCQDLALSLKALGQSQEAMAYAQRALAGRLKLLGPDAADTVASQRLVNRLTYSAAPASGAIQPTDADPPLVMVDGALIRASALKAELHTLRPPPLPALPNLHALQELAELDPKALLNHYASGKHTNDNLRPQFPEMRRSSSTIEANSQPVESDPSASRRKALDRLIDEQLLLNEWLRNDYTLKPSFVDEDIRRIIAENFKGSKDAFLADLAQKNVSEKAFRAERERMMILTVLRSRLIGEVKITPQEVR
jgi:tetratricopeptide (TPR) repeat protein